jgi:hypothetical protein
VIEHHLACRDSIPNKIGLAGANGFAFIDLIDDFRLQNRKNSLILIFRGLENNPFYLYFTVLCLSFLEAGR